MQNIRVRKSRSATDILLLCEDQCAMMVHIFANHSKYFCKQNLFFCHWEGSATVILLLSKDQESIFLQIIQSISYKNYLMYLSNRCKGIFVLEIWIRHSYLVVIWGSVSNEASRVHLCWQRCRLNLYFVTLHSFPSFLTSEVSFLLEELIPDNSKRLDFLPRQRHICKRL